MQKETVYNIDSAPLYLPTYDTEVAPGDGITVSKTDAESLIAGGLWSREKPGGKKK